jgi:hypothetical protein
MNQEEIYKQHKILKLIKNNTQKIVIRNQYLQEKIKYYFYSYL